MGRTTEVGVSNSRVRERSGEASGARATVTSSVGATSLAGVAAGREASGRCG